MILISLFRLLLVGGDGVDTPNIDAITWSAIYKTGFFRKKSFGNKVDLIWKERTGGNC